MPNLIATHLLPSDSESLFESAIDKSGWLFFAFNDGAVEADVSPIL